MKVSSTSDSSARPNKGIATEAVQVKPKKRSPLSPERQLELLDQKYPLSFIESDSPKLENIASRPVLTREDEKKLFLILQAARRNNDDELAKTVIERLYEHNTRLLIKLAGARCWKNKSKNNGREHFTNLVYDFMLTVTTFNPARGYKFSSYLCRAEQNNQIAAWKKENKHTQGQAKYREWFKYEGHTTQAPEELAEPEQANRLVEHVVGGKSELDQRSKAILIARFGLNGKKAQLLREIARNLGFTKERIRQIEHESLEKAAKIAAKLGICEDDV